MKEHRLQAWIVGAVRDAAGVAARPGAVVIRDGQLVAAGDPDQLHHRYLRHAAIQERPNLLLLPSFVNAHAHLDLTFLGPRPFGGDFAQWLRTVAASRPATPHELAAAVEQGVALSRAAGVEFVGDIAGTTTSVTARQATGLPGVSYLEVFGVGERQGRAIELLHERLETLEFETPSPGHTRGAVVGISPHAPYTAGRDLLDAATRLSEERAYRLCTHAAEAADEIAFLHDGTGPYADHLRHYGCTDADLAATCSGMHPLDHLEPYLKRARWLLAHCNFVEERHLKLLKRTGTSVVYCPIASDYFRHSHPEQPHRYREMLAAGINVCLGTDSILCQPPPDVEPQPMSILAQMRYLFRRDQTDPATLLAMATVNGMHALEFHERDATLGEGAPAVFATVQFDPRDPADALTQVLASREPVVPLRVV